MGPIGEGKCGVRTTTVRVAIAVLCLLTAFADAGFIRAGMTGAKVREFLGGKTGKAVHCDGFGRGLYLVDFSEEKLTDKLIVPLDTFVGYRSVELDPTGMFVSFASIGDSGFYSDVTTLKLDGGTPVKVGVGELPHWWVHPTTKKTYMIYRRATGLHSMELDADAKPVGTENVLLGAEAEKADGGRSLDGRLFAGDDPGHGMAEINAPWDGIANLSIKTHVYYAGAGNASAYCNGHICPNCPESSEFNNHLLHMGSNHTDIYVRKYVPANPQSTRNEFVRHFPAPSTFAPEGKTTHTHWHGSKWSWDERYGIANGIVCKSCHGNGEIYLLDIKDVKVLRVVEFGTKYPHLWVSAEPVGADGRTPIPRQRGAAGSVRVTPGGAIVAHAEEAATLVVTDVLGRVVYRANVAGPSHTLSAGSLPPGTYTAVLSTGNSTVSQRVCTAR